jgi:hypothetical protein
MIKFIFWSVLIYALVRFVFNFLIPVFRTASQMKKQVREFQDRVNTEHQYQNNTQASQPKPSPRPKSEDYIDFEEVK